MWPRAVLNAFGHMWLPFMSKNIKDAVLNTYGNMHLPFRSTNFDGLLWNSSDAYSPPAVLFFGSQPAVEATGGR